MDRTIARMLLEQELAQARQRGYGRLKADVGQEITKQIVGPDGKDYQISVSAGLGCAGGWPAAHHRVDRR
jgi:hypothetical protein